MKNSKQFTILKWVASIIGFVGAMTIALNIPESKYAFVIFAFSSTLWMYTGYIMKEYSIVFLNLGFFIVDMIGIYRWFF
jgi:hypothetical protein